LVPVLSAWRLPAVTAWKATDGKHGGDAAKPWTTPKQKVRENFLRADRVECHFECHRAKKIGKRTRGRERRQKLEGAKLLTSRALC
jgi:hypothetical protein